MNSKKEIIYVRLKEEIEKARFFPSGPSFKSMNKQVAELSINRGNELEGIFHLTESLGVSLRLLSQYKSRARLAKNEACVSLDCKYLDFSMYADTDGLLKRLQELPEEWTVVHLSLSHKPEETFLLPNSRSKNLKLWFCLLPTGNTSDKPVAQEVDYTCRVEDKMQTPLEVISRIIIDNKNKPKQYYGDPKKYWEVRKELENSLEQVLNDIEFSWLSMWRFLLLGDLKKSAMRKATALLDQILLDHCTTPVNDRAHYLLCRVATSSRLLTSVELYSLVDELLQGSRDSKIVTSKIRDSFKWVDDVERNPVVLIVDEVLDKVPWESMSILKGQPITRAACLPILHALYKVHSDEMKDGYKLVDTTNGYYIINPQCNLENMEERFRQFLPRRLPMWKGIFGKCERDDFMHGLEDYSVCLYSGHGSGRDVLPSSRVEMASIHSVVFLMGCCSTSMVHQGGLAEHTTIVQHYQTGTCPQVIGNLWEISDSELDRMTSSLLHCWTLLDAEQSKNLCTYLPSIHSKDLGYKRQPDLLRALSASKKWSRYKLTSCALVARGLPVKAKS